MHEAKQIERIDPAAGIPGGEVTIECGNPSPGAEQTLTVWFQDHAAHVVAATPNRALVLVPDLSLGAEIEVSVDPVGRPPGKPAHFVVAGKVADGIHQVASPAFDPSDGHLMNAVGHLAGDNKVRSEEHTSELQSHS